MSKLYQNLCLPVTLYSAWKVVKKKNSAGGIDGLSVLQFEEKLAFNLEALRKDLVQKTWNPEPYLRVNIAKNAVETRKIGLLSVRDKIVQQAIKTLIEPRMEKLFLNNSYGYRPGRGPARAIGRVVHVMQQMKNGYMAKLDIDDYFDTIQHKRRNKVAKILEQYGVRINFSVFECLFTESQYQKVRQMIASQIDTREDTVVYYQICVNCFTKIIYMPERTKTSGVVKIV